jgi:hypothetical protein
MLFRIVNDEISEPFRATAISNPDWESIKDTKPTNPSDITTATQSVAMAKSPEPVSKRDKLMRFTWIIL